MISNEKMEEYWLRYKSEGVAKGLSLQAYCSTHNIPYNAFEKYLKLRRHFSTAHRIEVTDVPTTEEISATGTPAGKGNDGTSEIKPEPVLSIMIGIRMNNGIRVQQKNLDYNGLEGLVEKLEVLC